jgi:hypothetical protein
MCWHCPTLIKILKSTSMPLDAPPSSLMTQLRVQRWKQWKEKELGCTP